MLGRLIWRWFPELDLFPPDEKGRALRRAGNNWQTNLIGVPVAVVALVNIHYLDPILCSALPLPPWVVSSILALMWGGVAFWGLWLTRARIRRKLRQELISDGFLICGPCGYDLRGLTEPRCPECGTHFDEELLRKND